MSKWIADREPALSSSLCLWSSRPSPLRAMHARFTMRQAVGAISEWGLGRGARRQIQSDRELRCACHRVRRGVRRRLRRVRRSPTAKRRGWKDAKSGSDSPPGSCSGSNLRLPPTSCARRWRRPGDISDSPSSPPSAPCSTTFWRGHHGVDKSQKAGSEGRSLGKTARSGGQALLISWTLRRICGSFP